MAQINCATWGCWIAASVCAMEMNGMPWLIWYALYQTVPSLWEWLLIKGAWTHWMHATMASGRTYIFIACTQIWLKWGTNGAENRQSAWHRQALLPCSLLIHEGFTKTSSTCEWSHPVLHLHLWTDFDLSKFSSWVCHNIKFSSRIKQKNLCSPKTFYLLNDRFKVYNDISCRYLVNITMTGVN